MSELEEYEKKWNQLSFPYHPSYEQREAVKTIAWKIIALSKIEKNYRKSAFYLLNGVIWSHYWRAREGLENSPKLRSHLRKIREKKYYPGYELDIDHYTCHWLASNGRDLIDENVIEYIKDEYGYEAEKNKYLPSGSSEYHGF